MTPKEEFNQTLKVVSDAIMQVISNYDLVSELPDGKNTNFIPNLYTYVRKEWNWALSKGKYDLLQDMLIDLYQLMFIDRADKLLKAYKRKGQQEKTSAPHLIAYLKLPMLRAFQEISKKYWNKYKYEQEQFEYEEETQDQKLDRLLHAPKQNKIHQFDDSYIEEIDDQIKAYQIMLDENKDDKAKTKRLQTKIDKLQNRREELLHPKLDTVIKNVDEFIEKEFSIEEEIAFEKLVETIKSDFSKSKDDAKAQIQVLELLLADFSPSEIARIMQVSPARISKRIKILKEDIKEIADMFASRGDDSLKDMMRKYMSSSNSVIGNRMVVKDDKILTAQITVMGLKIK